MGEIVMPERDPREGAARQLIDELDAYQEAALPAESNYGSILTPWRSRRCGSYSVAVDGVKFWAAAGSGFMMTMRK